MPRPGDVWRNKWKNGAWYATIRGVKTRVAEPHDSKETALQRWHQAMAIDRVADKQESNPFKVVVELYLQMAAREGFACLRERKRYLRGFLREWDDIVVADLEPAHVTVWLRKHPHWAANTQRDAISSVVAALEWAAAPEQRYIPTNPLKGLKRPAPVSRGAESLIDPAVAARLYEAAPPALQRVLFALEQTGARPGSICIIEANDCLWEQRVIRLDKHKTRKKTGKPLLIPMTETLRDLLRMLALRHPEGPLFRTARGKRWTLHWLDTCFLELVERLGLDPRPTLYHYRHTFATDLLSSGMSGPKVAAILGHQGTKMIEFHYGHLDARLAELAEDLDDAINPRTGRGRDAG
jgi:integrase